MVRPDHANIFVSRQKKLIYLFGTANLLNVHGPILNRPASWMLAAFAPVLGDNSKWPGRGGNSKSIRSIEIMMEVNDCLYEGWNEYTRDTHCEEWPDGSSAETHIVRAGSINDKPEGDKALGSPLLLSCH